MFQIIEYFNFNISRYTFNLPPILKSHLTKKKSIEFLYRRNIHVHHNFSCGYLSLYCQISVLRRFIISMLLNDLQSHGQSDEAQ